MHMAPNLMGVRLVDLQVWGEERALGGGQEG